MVQPKQPRFLRFGRLKPFEEGGLLEFWLFKDNRPSSSATFAVSNATCAVRNPTCAYNAWIRSSFSATLSRSRSGRDSMNRIINFNNYL